MQYQLTMAFLLLPFAWLSGQVDKAVFSPIVWVSLLFQGVVVSFGVLLLHEPPSVSFVAGALLVLAGIAMVSRTALPPLRSWGGRRQEA